MAFIEVRHNIEVAHRLSLTKGKCEQIHGHSMWVKLRINGKIDPKSGMLRSRPTSFVFGMHPTQETSLEFGAVKQAFRDHLDTQYDHKLLLNEEDPFAQPAVWSDLLQPTSLPGLATCPGDPTTENIARWIAKWAAEQFSTDVFVDVSETAVNAAGVQAFHTESGIETR